MNNNQINDRLFPRIVLLSLILLLGVTLAACGGDDAAPEAESTEVAAPTASATEPAAVEPTAVVLPTEAPTEAPAEPTAEPTAAEVAQSGDCGNAFYPVVEGRALTYQTTLPGMGTETFTTVYSDVSDSSFTITTDLGDGNTLSQTWQCSGEGMLSPEFSQLQTGIEGIEIEFVEASGVSIPSEDLFQPGGTWTTHYVANAIMGDEGAGAMTMVQTVDLTNTVVGTEAVTVPAGEFPEAVRVDTTGTITIAMSAGDDAAPATSLEMNYSAWYVEGIGMVLQDFSDFFGDATGSTLSELVSVAD